MLARYGEEAMPESVKRTEELAANGDLAGVALWLRVIEAIRQLAITTPFEPLQLAGAASAGRIRVSWRGVNAPISGS